MAAGTVRTSRAGASSAGCEKTSSSLARSGSSTPSKTKD